MFLSEVAYCCHKFVFLRPFLVFCVGCVFLGMVSVFSSAQEQCTQVFEKRGVPAASKEGWKKLNPVVVPPSLKKKYKETGYRSHYSTGLDEVLKIQLLAREMRHKNIDPQTTHIADFADQVENHIAFFESGFASQSPGGGKSIPSSKAHAVSPKSHRGRELTPQTPSDKRDPYFQSFFVKEDPHKFYSSFQKWVRKVRTRVKQEQLTYPFWVEFNYHLVNLIQGTNYNERRAKMLSITDNFPNYIYFPTVRDLGIMAFNQVDTEGIILVGLVKERVEVDGVVFHPEKFFHHDAAHFRYGTKKVRPEEKHFHARWLKYLPLLTKAQRERVELIYFLLTHENRSPRPLQYMDKEYLYEEILPKTNRFYREPEHIRDMEHLLPPSVDRHSRTDIQDYLKKSVDDFLKVAQQSVSL